MKYADTMQLNLHDHHVPYIFNFNAYAHKYQCKTCDRHFLQSMEHGETSKELIIGFPVDFMTHQERIRQTGRI